MYIHSRSLANSVSVFLDVLVGFLGDHYPNVVSKSKAALEKFSSRQVTENANPLVEILEESLYSLATSLPRQIHSGGKSNMPFM